MAGNRERALSIDVVSDVVCPWCFIGKRRLEAALAQLGSERGLPRPVVTWQPFELNPDLPREGIDRRDYLDAKFGGRERAAQIYERVRAAGATVGIAFEFDRITRQPNTLDAHRLIAWAQARGDAEPLVERLFRAYFLEGRPIGEQGVLVEIAAESGLDRAAARTMLATGEGVESVRDAIRRFVDLGVGGVPFFILGNRFAVSGAQEPRVLLDAIHEAVRPEVI
jgi:predicted DsbA family dithiol-disulfide isomerase